jgi:anti-sigma B factor antagonist
MPVRCDEYEDVAVLVVEGDLVDENSRALRQHAEQRADDARFADFVVDLEKCDFADSEGLETLLWLQRRCDERFGQSKLAGVTDNLRKILQITRLDSRFQIQSDLAGALRHMR